MGKRKGWQDHVEGSMWNVLMVSHWHLIWYYRRVWAPLLRFNDGTEPPGLRDPRNLVNCFNQNFHLCLPAHLRCSNSVNWYVWIGASAVALGFMTCTLSDIPPHTHPVRNIQVSSLGLLFSIRFHYSLEMLFDVHVTLRVGFWSMRETPL